LLIVDECLGKILNRLAKNLDLEKIVSTDKSQLSLSFWAIQNDQNINLNLLEIDFEKKE
jgi:hypothetical protein